ncbi:aldehyde dehydrogenase [Aurantiacibacter xanthus]|uniref:Aldehyde dehydrogenase n=1 Tax=Aurantiacibacter xanthus TaxID=1784712 RepID=A0A3A1P047_9SPHN|nr:aldehyde dehydrogenase [Aurantiacibacter xanthus]RIV80069.1 aldehyde dehydrogenase [Aurantiacibacter xanthus]
MLPANIALKHPDRVFIDDLWVEPTSDKVLKLVDPASEEVVGEIAEASAADMDRAVAAARKAFDHGPWPQMPVAERVALIEAMADILEQRHGELAEAWTSQVGGLASFAPVMVGGGTMTLRHIAGMAREFAFVEQRPAMMTKAAIVAHEPVGVVAAIAPWNAPYQIMIGKVGCALAAGCTVIMKPSPETPIEAYIIAEAAEEAGLPPGVLNLVCGDREASDSLICDARVDKVAFTGSTGVGKRIATVCGERIGRYTLELGGKSAALLLDDFPTGQAAEILGNTITMMSGQVCAMLSRVIVPQHRHDELAEAIKAVMERVTIGAPRDPATQLGPLAMKRQLDRVLGYVEEGKAQADLVTGGQRPAHMGKGFYVEPTLFANVDNQSRIAQEEIFGPVLCLIPAKDEEDAIRLANESHYGLNGAVLTNDPNAAYRVGRRLRTGGVGQNGMKLEFTVPFGGFKQSGIGREGGLEGLLGYTESKTLLLDGLPDQFA